VQEFQIITNGYAAEYGRASGGVVNIITPVGIQRFHGDVLATCANRNFQAVNPFSTEQNPAYTRVQAEWRLVVQSRKTRPTTTFSYEITRRHETGFSSIGQNNFDLVNFDTANVGMPFGPLQLSPGQIAFLTVPQGARRRAGQRSCAERSVAIRIPGRRFFRASNSGPVANSTGPGNHLRRPLQLVGIPHELPPARPVCFKPPPPIKRLLLRWEISRSSKVRAFIRCGSITT